MRIRLLSKFAALGLLATVAGACGDDDSTPTPDSGTAIDAAMPVDSSVVVDAKVADASPDAFVFMDAAVASQSGTIVVSELNILPNAITGANAFDTASTSVSYTPTAMATTGLQYAKNPANPSPVGNCFGYAFGAGIANPPTGGGNAGPITITGHISTANGGCTPIAGVAGCAAPTINCTRGAAPFNFYTCDGPGGPVVDFLKEAPVAATDKLTITAAGGSDIDAFTATPSYLGNVVYDGNTTTALATQKWDGTAPFTATITPPAGVTPGVMILRIEATDGNPGLAGMQADCTAADAAFPTLGHCNTMKQANITCAEAVQTTIMVPAAAFTATFNATGLVKATGTTAHIVRVTVIGTGSIAPTSPATANPNKTLVAAGQGQVFIDTTP